MRRPFLHSTATRLSLLAAFIWIGSILATAQITIPYPTFVAGTVIDPDQVNSNFSTLGTTALNRTGGTLTGNMAVSTNITIDGADISDFLGATNLTVPGTSTLSGSLLFTADNTHDIGAAGATRARDFFLGRNALVGGTLGVTGATTLGTTTLGTTTLGSNVTIDGADVSDYLDGSGNLTVTGTTTLNTVAYTWPSAQGAAGTALRNNGSGTVSWGWASGVSSQSSTFTASNAVDYYLITATATVNLPACDGTRTGKWFHVKLTAAASTVTLDGNASETIDGATTYAWSQQYAAISIVCNGAGAWSIF